MTLQEYIKVEGRGSIATLAKQIGIKLRLFHFGLAANAKCQLIAVQTSNASQKAR